MITSSTDPISGLWVGARLGSIAAAVIVGSKLTQIGLEWLAASLADTAAPTRVQDELPVKSLSQLCRNGTVSLQKSAAQMLLDRAMRPNHIQYIIRCCGQPAGSKGSMTLEAVTTLSLFAKSKRNRDVLLRYKAVPALVRCLEPTVKDSDKAASTTMIDSDETCQTQAWVIQRAALMVLFDLTFHSTEAKLEAVSLHVLVLATKLLDESPSKDVQYWALALLHSFIMEASLHPHFQKEDIVVKLARVAELASGNATMQKMAMQGLVSLTAGDDEQHHLLLDRAVQQGIVPCTVVALNSDEPELVYWALGLLHEIALKQVAIEQIKSATLLVYNLYKALSSSDAASQKIVLRIIGFLAIKDDDFKFELLDFGFPERLGICIGSGDVEVAHWAIVIVHDMAMLGLDACLQIIEAGTCIPAMVQISKKDESLARLSAETFGLVCASETLHEGAIENGILNGIKFFAVSTASDLQLWAALLLLNMVMTNRNIRSSIIGYDCIGTLIELTLNANHDDIPEMSAKALGTLSLDDRSVCESIQIQLMVPMLDRLCQCHSDMLPVDVCQQLNLLGLLFRVPEHRLFAIQHDDMTLFTTIIQNIENFVELSPWTVQLLQDYPQRFHETSSLCLASCKVLSFWSADPACCALLVETGAFRKISSLLGVAIDPLFVFQSIVRDVIKRYPAAAGMPESDILALLGSPYPATPSQPLDEDDYGMHVISSTPQSEAPKQATSASPSLARLGGSLQGAHRRRSLKFEFGAVSPSARASSSHALLAVPNDMFSPSPRGLARPRSALDGVEPRGGLRHSTAGSPVDDFAAATSTFQLFSPREGPSQRDGANTIAAHPDVFSPRTRWLPGSATEEHDADQADSSAIHHRVQPRLSIATATDLFVAAPAMADSMFERAIDAIDASTRGIDQTNQPPSAIAPLSDGPENPAESLGPPEVIVAGPTSPMSPSALFSVSPQPDSSGRGQSESGQDLRGPGEVSTEVSGPPIRPMDFRSRIARRLMARTQSSPTPHHDRRSHSSGARGHTRSGETRERHTRSGEAQRGGSFVGSPGPSEHRSELIKPELSSFVDTTAQRAATSPGRSPAVSVSRQIGSGISTAKYDDAEMSQLGVSSLGNQGDDDQSDSDSDVDGLPLRMPSRASRTQPQPSMANQSPLRTIEFANQRRSGPRRHAESRRQGNEPPHPARRLDPATDRVAAANRQRSGHVAQVGAVTISEQREPMGSHDESLMAPEFKDMLASQWDEWDESVIDMSFASDACDPTGDSLLSPSPSQSLHSVDQSFDMDSSMLRSVERSTGAANSVLKDRLILQQVIREVAEQIVTALTLACYAGVEIPEIRGELITNCGCYMWSMMYAGSSPKISFLTSAFMGLITGAHLTHRDRAVEMSPSLSTPNLLISPDMLAIRNEAWTFESAFANASAAAGRQSYYEVKVLSDGIVQVGWASPHTKVSPEFGQGIGDSARSFSYDGCRGCLWTGVGNTHEEQNRYGDKWQIGDVVGCVIDLDRGEAGFLLNGRDLGIGLSNLNVEDEWYPAISVATAQQVEVNFGTDAFWMDPPASVEALVLSASSKQEYLKPVQKAAPAMGLMRGVQLEPTDLEIMSYYEIKGLAPASWAGFQMPSVASMRRWCGVVSEQGLFQACVEDDGVPISDTSVIGCGVTLQSNGATRVFFTLDGELLAHGLAIAKSCAVLPWFSCKRADINFGQRAFAYAEADSPPSRATVGKQYLHWANAYGRVYAQFR